MGLDSTTLDVGGDTLTAALAELAELPELGAMFDDTDVIVLEQVTREEIELAIGDATDRSTRRACTESDWPPAPPPPQAHARRRKAVYAVVDLIEI